MGNTLNIILPIEIWSVVLENSNYKCGIMLSSTCKVLYNWKSKYKYHVIKPKLLLSPDNNITLRDYHFFNWMKALSHCGLNTLLKGIYTDLPKHTIVNSVFSLDDNKFFRLADSQIIDHGNLRHILIDAKCSNCRIIFDYISYGYYNIDLVYYCDKFFGKHSIVYDLGIDAYNTYYIDNIVTLDKKLKYKIIAYSDKIYFQNNNWFNNIFINGISL